jgi:hypothetical protein
MLVLQVGFPAGVLVDRKSLSSVGQELVAPRVVLGWTELRLGANLRHRFACEPLKHDQRFRFGIPFPAWHG